jgi:hypothetical protein
MPSTPHSQTTSDDMLSGLTSECRGIDINCLRKAEALDATQCDLVRQLLRVWQFAWASPKQAQRLGYLLRCYRQRVGQGG